MPEHPERERNVEDDLARQVERPPPRGIEPGGWHRAAEQERFADFDPWGEHNGSREPHVEEAVMQPHRVALDGEERVRPRWASRRAIAHRGTAR